jgi:nitrate/TMAO reductase-like tetraheme cytochrome c subunit
VELWGENCSRCHNIRPPNEFSGAQWAAIVHHMRFRANLTGEEEREITKFLQASN